MPRLIDSTYLAFPFTVDKGGPKNADNRERHVRGQIEQTLFTLPGERVFRREFGAGVKRLVFEPNTEALREMVRKRLSATLAEVLSGEVDPQTLDIEVSNEGATSGADGRLDITVRYRLATVNRDETDTFHVRGGAGG